MGLLCTDRFNQVLTNVGLQDDLAPRDFRGLFVFAATTSSRPGPPHSRGF